MRLPRTQLAVGDQRQRGALGDRAAEQAVGRGTGQQRQHRRRPGRLAEHGHPVGITAERGDVLPDPSQCGHLVTQREVVVESVAQVAEFEAAEHPDAVGDVDHHHVSVGGQSRPVVELELAGPEYERAAGNPHHHRQRATGVGRPHRQCQTCFVAHLGVVTTAADERLALRRERSVFECIAHTRPRLQRSRGQKPAFADGLLGVRHAAPDRDAALGRAAKVPQAGVHDGRMSNKDCHA